MSMGSNPGGSSHGTGAEEVTAVAAVCGNIFHLKYC